MEFNIIVRLFAARFHFKEQTMQPKDYEIIKIEGEYATLRDTDGEELFIALALLPPCVDIGSRLRYDFPDFEVIS